MIDIQSATAEIRPRIKEEDERRRRKKKKPQYENIMAALFHKIKKYHKTTRNTFGQKYCNSTQ